MKLSIVVPCYNEQEVFKDTARQLTELVGGLISKGKITSDSYILFVNDGSKDNTWNLIAEECGKNEYVRGLKLAHNVGHQNALFAGLMTAKEDSDAAISIDADLQDDIAVIEQMIDKYNNGFDIVYGVRSERKSDTFFKRTSAQAFYKLMNGMGVNTVYNHADYRLMSKRSLDNLSEYKERNLFLRGVVPLIGYNTDTVYYVRKERTAGESKYPLKKMLSFAWDGITSFSTKPISLICVLGMISILIGIIAAIYGLISWANGTVVSGWTSLFLAILFMGGVQLLSIGIVGQYVGKTYMEVKERPRYVIETYLTNNKE